MRAIKIIIGVFLGVPFLGCNNSPTATANTDTVRQDSINTIAPAKEEDTTGNKPVYTRPPNGIYRILLSSIEHIIHFHPDQSYLLEEKKGETITRTKGNWKPTNGVIWTYRDQIVQGKYSWLGDTLAYIDNQSQKTIPMQKLSSVLENNVWRNKKKEGIEFFGVGNEPFWSVEIDEQKNISFQLADWSKALVFKPAPPATYDDSIVYQLSSDIASIKITILNQFCSDGMSDFIYDNKVEVLYNKQIFSGCGILYK